MEKKDFDPQSEFDNALAELNMKKDSGLKDNNPFKKMFSKSKSADNAPSNQGMEEQNLYEEDIADLDFDPNNSEFDRNRSRFDLNRSHLDPDEIPFDNSTNSFDDEQFADDNEYLSTDEFTRANNDAPREKKGSIAITILKVVVALLIVAIIGLAAYLFLKPSASEAPAIADSNVVKVDKTDNTKQGKAEKTDATPTAKDTNEASDDTKVAVDANLANPNQDSETTTAATEALSSDTEATIDDEEAKKILAAEIPADESLVKEEIDKLSDKSTRLEKQEELLVQRVDMMDELTQKKEEQIALLEKQIAQLEAESKAE